MGFRDALKPNKNQIIKTKQVKFIDQIRQSIGSYFFRRDLAKVHRNRCIMNLNDAKIIGLIYNASDEVTYDIISNFVKYFQENQKIVKALGYVNYNRLPYYCFPKLSYDYFTKRDLNWYFKPTNLRVTDFINEEFDIVIDLSMTDCFPLNYISGLSKGKFKVGRYSDKYSSIYDFMLNIDNNISLEKYIQETIRYLNIINRNAQQI